MSGAEWNCVVAIDERLRKLEREVDQLVRELARLQQLVERLAEAKTKTEKPQRG